MNFLSPLLSAVVVFLFLATASAGDISKCENMDDIIATTPIPPQTPIAMASLKKSLAEMPLETDTVLVGDSLIEQWSTAPQDFPGKRTWNFGVGGDRTQQVLWRLKDTRLQKLRPKSVVVMAGRNNFSDAGMTGCGVATGVEAIVEKINKLWPGAKIWVMAITPRGADFKSSDNSQRLAANARLSAGSTTKAPYQFVSIDDNEISCGGYGGPKLPDNILACFPLSAHKCSNYRGDYLHLAAPGYKLLRKYLKNVGFN